MVMTTMIREAQQRGTDIMDVNDLIVSLIIEDQEPNAAFLFNEAPSGALWNFVPPGANTSSTAHEPFFPPRVAIDLLVKMNGFLPKSNSLPSTTQMQTSPALERVLNAAQQLPAQLNQSKVQIRNSATPGMYQAVVPLDLLAAALREPCEGTKLLQAAGITEEKVLQTIQAAVQAGGDLETGRLSSPRHR